MSCVPVRISCSLSCFYQWPSYLAALSSPESQPLPAMHLTINFFIISKVMLMINQWIILGRYKGYRRKNKVKDEDRSDRVKGRWKDLADEVTFDQKPDWNEEAGHVEIWKRTFQEKRKLSKKPLRWKCSRISKKTHVAGTLKVKRGCEMKLERLQRPDQSLSQRPQPQ